MEIVQVVPGGVVPGGPRSFVCEPCRQAAGGWLQRIVPTTMILDRWSCALYFQGTFSEPLCRAHYQNALMRRGPRMEPHH